MYGFKSISVNFIFVHAIFVHILDDKLEKFHFKKKLISFFNLSIYLFIFHKFCLFNLNISLYNKLIIDE